GEARTGVGAVFIGGGFYPKRTRSHGGALTSGTSRSPCRWRRRIISDRVTVRKPPSPRSFTNREESPFASFTGPLGCAHSSRRDCRVFAFEHIHGARLGDRREAPPKNISAPGRGRRRAPGDVAHRNGASLSDAADHDRRALPGGRAHRYARAHPRRASSDIA